MKSFRALFYAPLIVSLSAFGAVELTEIQDQLNRSLYACPERIWPGLDWSQKHLIVAWPSRDESYLLHKDSALKLPAGVATSFGSDFDFGEWHGAKAVFFNLETEVDRSQLFGFLVHEGFHHFDQEFLDAQGYSTAGRDDAYPFNPEPRIQREELKQALMRYLVSKDQAELARAAFWYKAYRKGDDSTGIDLIEGSASYFEKVTVAIADSGCSTTEDTIVKTVAGHITNEGQHAIGDKSSEPYLVGALAFLVARERNMLPAYLSRLDGSTSIFDLVFENIAPEAATPSLETTSAVEASIRQQNAQAEETLLPILTALETGTEMVFVPRTSMIGSFGYEGGFDSEIGSVLANLRVTTKYGIVSGNAFRAKACGDTEGFMILTQPLPGAGTPSTYQKSPITCY